MDDNEWNKLKQEIAWGHAPSSKYPSVYVVACPHCGVQNSHTVKNDIVGSHRECDLRRDSRGRRLHYDCPRYIVCRYIDAGEDWTYCKNISKSMNIYPLAIADGKKQQQPMWKSHCCFFPSGDMGQCFVSCKPFRNSSNKKIYPHARADGKKNNSRCGSLIVVIFSVRRYGSVFCL